MSSRFRRTQRQPSGGPSGKLLTAVGCGVFTICAACLPYYMTRNVKPLQSREEVRMNSCTFHLMLTSQNENTALTNNQSIIICLHS